MSKATDNSGEHLFTGGSPSFLQDARNRDSWEGPADADTRHRVAANWIVDLPFGFNFSGITTALTPMQSQLLRVIIGLTQSADAPSDHSRH